MYDHLRDRAPGSALDEAKADDALAPGKRTLTSQLPRRFDTNALAAKVVQMLSDDVQMKDGDARDPARTHEVARAGLSGSAQQLPHFDALQRAFGRFDLSGVKAYVGGNAATANAQLGARAYATGDSIAFKSHPDLRTAAHEAAHIIQQRLGVALRGGVGQRGDSYEQHADLVADEVVAGRSVESLLGGGRAASASTGAGVQKQEVQLWDDTPDGGVPLPGGVPDPAAGRGGGSGGGSGGATDVAPDAGAGGAGGAGGAAPDAGPGPDAGASGTTGAGGGGGGGGGGAQAEGADAAIPAPQPAPTPPEPALGPQPTPRPPAPGGNPTPDSGIDWAGFWGGTGGNVVRSVLELSRFVPGWGLLGGLAADGIEGYQNYASLDKVAGTPAGDRFRNMMIAREVVVAVNNVLGHVRYVNALITDGLIASVIGAEFAPLSASVAEILAIVNILLQSFQLGMDLGIAVAAGMQMNQHGEGTPEYQAYHNLRTTFVVNTASDVIGVFLDIADTASGGLAQGAVIKQAKGAIKATTITVRQMRGSVLPLINNWISIWGAQVWQWITGSGGSGTSGGGDNADADASVQHMDDPFAVIQMTGGGGEQGRGEQVGPGGMLRSVAGQIMMNEINEIEQAYQFGAGFVEYAMGLPQQIGDQVSELITEVTGHPEPFIWLRDKLAEGITEGSAQIARMLQLSSAAGQAQAAAQTVIGHTDRALASIDQFRLPNIPEPQASDFGDNILARGAASVVDTARGLSASAVRAVRDRLQTGVDRVKGEARAKAEEVKSNMEWGVEFLTQFQAELNQQTGQIEQLGAQFAARLSQCNNVEDVFNMLLGLGAEIMGAEEFTVDDLRQMWQDLRAAIDQGFQTAREVAQGVAGGGAASPSAGASAPASGGREASPAGSANAGGSPGGSNASANASGGNSAPAASPAATPT